MAEIETEKSLITRALTGDQDAYTSLYNTHHPLVLSVLIRCMRGDIETARDLAQETFLNAFRVLPNFRGESKFSTWLYRIAYSRFLMYRRDFNRHAPAISLELMRAAFNDAGVPQAKFDPPITDHTLVNIPLKVTLNGIIPKLPPSQRMVFSLRLQEYRFEEIGQIMGIATGTAKSQHQKAKEKVRNYLAR